MQGCDRMQQILDDRAAILDLVQRKMHRIAPNLSEAVGTEIAAQLMGAAGGLTNLSRMPAGNVQVIWVLCWCIVRVVGMRMHMHHMNTKKGITCVQNVHHTPCITHTCIPTPTTHHTPSFPPKKHTHTQLLGAKRKTLAGFSSTASQRHQGYIFNCEIVQNTPPALRVKAARLVGAKCTLLARVDAYGQVCEGGVRDCVCVIVCVIVMVMVYCCWCVMCTSAVVRGCVLLCLASVCVHPPPPPPKKQQDPVGNTGQAFKTDMLRKVEKWQEPPPAKIIKPLPAPDGESKKRRGGRKHRRMKERMGITDVKRAANRVNFNQPEEEIIDGDDIIGLGLLGSKEGSGRLRVQAQQQKQKLSAKIMKKNKNRMSGLQTSGLASTLALSTVGGIDLVDPTAVPGGAPEDDFKAGTESYFSEYQGFRSLAKK